VRRRLFGLSRRLTLTYRYLGLRGILWKALTLPVRSVVRLFRPRQRSTVDVATEWFEFEGRPVTIVIPTYGPPDDLERTLESIEATVPSGRARVLVCDDGSSTHDRRRLREVVGRFAGVGLIEGEENVGFAGNVNRGLEAAAPELDVVLLNSDVVAQKHWLASLQWTAYRAPDIGVVGAKLLYPDGRIQHAGAHRNLGAPEWFDHRWRFRPSFYLPANVGEPALAVTGACMYIKREVLDRLGPLDAGFPMAYEDVDLCLRAWQEGYRVLYCPSAQLTHHESVTRGVEVGERERRSQTHFWDKWGDFLDRRSVRTPDDRLRIVYVLEDTGIGGGTRVIFEHLNALVARGHDVALWTVKSAPTWFDLRAPVREFDDYDALTAALAELDAIKVATWWNTAAPVWRASILRGVPVYFVQDIETAYYPDDKAQEAHILSSYRPEFHYLTTSGWIRDRLTELGFGASIVAPGIDLETFRPLPIAMREDMLLAVGRSNPLKNLSLTIDAWSGLSEPRPELCLYGIEPELGVRHGSRYVERPSDKEVNELLNQTTAFLQTSTHEGFCLPVLEAMAAGAPVVCTDADGNRDYCRDGDNCLMPAAEPAAVSQAIARLLNDRDLRERLAEEGRRTAQHYSWKRRIDELEAFFLEVSERRAAAPPPPALVTPGHSRTSEKPGPELEVLRD
jgi:GT2 family glycosyltransferase